MIKQILFITYFILITEGKSNFDFFYENLSCKPIESSNSIGYDCPTLSQRNGTCVYKNEVFKYGEYISENLLKGSCAASCFCSHNGKLVCAHYDCFQRFQEGCSHFKYSLDSCCPVGSICGNSTITCKVNDEIYKEGQTYHLKDKCERCVCDEPKICKPRSCWDQLYYPTEIMEGAPVFFKSDKCCPSTWTTNEGEKMIKLSDETNESTCKYGNLTVKFGYGFEKTIQPYSELIKIKCECKIPPLLLCENL